MSASLTEVQASAIGAGAFTARLTANARAKSAQPLTTALILITILQIATRISWQSAADAQGYHALHPRTGKIKWSVNITATQQIMSLGRAAIAFVMQEGGTRTCAWDTSAI